MRTQVIGSLVRLLTLRALEWSHVEMHSRYMSVKHVDNFKRFPATWARVWSRVFVHLAHVSCQMRTVTEGVVTLLAHVF